MPSIPLIYSTLRRKEHVQGHRLDVCIYRRGTTAWALMVISSTGHSKVWDGVFVSEQSALDEYQRMVDGQQVARTLGIDNSLEETFDLNPALLKPIDQRLRDPLKLGIFTLRKFEIIKKILWRLAHQKHQRARHHGLPLRWRCADVAALAERRAQGASQYRHRVHGVRQEHRLLPVARPSAAKNTQQLVPMKAAIEPRRSDPLEGRP